MVSRFGVSSSGFHDSGFLQGRGFGLEGLEVLGFGARGFEVRGFGFMVS